MPTKFETVRSREVLAILETADVAEGRIPGNPVPPSFHHLLVIRIEAAKVIALLVLGTGAARKYTA